MDKTLLLTLEYPPQKGGVATYLYNEVQHYQHVEVIDVNPYLSRLWPRWLPLLWRIKPKYATTIWVSHVLPIGYVSLLWRLFYRIPYRVYLHGLDLVRPKKSIWKKFWVRIILKNADEIIVNSTATAQLLTIYTINPQKAQIVYPKIIPIDTERYNKRASEFRKSKELNGVPIILTIARLVKRKGIGYVIRAMPIIWKQYPDAVYVVLGKGADQERLKKIAEQVAPSGTQHKNELIIFEGEVSDDEKYMWLAACDCFILTPVNDADDFEGYGIVYKEAQQFKKAVIGTSVGGVPEAIGTEGIVIEPENSQAIAGALLGALSKCTY